MYYRLNLAEKKITTISTATMEAESNLLLGNNYEIVFLPNLQSFINNGQGLPGRAILIADTDVYINILALHLTRLLEARSSIIVFLPLLFSTNSNQYHGRSVKLLNDFIFSEEFKNIFGYAQQGHPAYPESGKMVIDLLKQ